MTAELTDEDRGKEVVSGTERVGVVEDVRTGTAYVDPDWSNVPDQLRDALDWDRSDDTYPLDESAITAVRNDQVRLRDDLNP